MSQTKETNIENRTLYIFDDMINIKTFGVNLFSYLGFVSRTFTNHRTASEGGRVGGWGGILLTTYLPLPPTSQTLRH